jgi:hypothetical protein
MRAGYAFKSAVNTYWDEEIASGLIGASSLKVAPFDTRLNGRVLYLGFSYAWKLGRALAYGTGPLV